MWLPYLAYVSPGVESEVSRTLGKHSDNRIMSQPYSVYSWGKGRKVPWEGGEPAQTVAVLGLWSMRTEEQGRATMRGQMRAAATRCESRRQKRESRVLGSEKSSGRTRGMLQATKLALSFI